MTLVSSYIIAIKFSCGMAICSSFVKSIFATTHWPCSTLINLLEVKFVKSTCHYNQQGRVLT